MGPIGVGWRAIFLRARENRLPDCFAEMEAVTSEVTAFFGGFDLVVARRSGRRSSSHPDAHRRSGRRFSSNRPARPRSVAEKGAQWSPAAEGLVLQQQVVIRLQRGEVFLLGRLDFLQHGQRRIRVGRKPSAAAAVRPDG